MEENIENRKDTNTKFLNKNKDIDEKNIKNSNQNNFNNISIVKYEFQINNNIQNILKINLEKKEKDILNLTKQNEKYKNNINIFKITQLNDKKELENKNKEINNLKEELYNTNIKLKDNIKENEKILLDFKNLKNIYEENKK